jgi:hypothetical protein
MKTTMKTGVVIITGPMRKSVWPAVVQTFDPITCTWKDGKKCWAKHLNGGILMPSQRYAGLRSRKRSPGRRAIYKCS